MKWLKKVGVITCHRCEPRSLLFGLFGRDESTVYYACVYVHNTAMTIKGFIYETRHFALVLEVLSSFNAL